jgi:threonine aldolase
MARADVGDDVFAEDPSVNLLQKRAAEMFGKEAALFVPSGTMANLLAALSLTQPGDTVILSEDSHPFNYESGNLGMIAGVLTCTVPSTYGIMAPEDVAARIVVSPDHHFSNTTLVSIENTANRGGGSIYPLEVFSEIGRIAHQAGLACHCDGARLFNAVVETGIGPEVWASHVDTISFCLSKGLGCPVGSILLGTAGVIDKAHRYRKMLGGGMRQAGVLAAAGLYALDHHIERLKEDHRRAQEFRRQIEKMGYECPWPSPTNMVYVTVPDSAQFAAQLAERGVRVSTASKHLIRAVFHLDVDDDALRRAVDAFKSAQ